MNVVSINFQCKFRKNSFQEVLKNEVIKLIFNPQMFHILKSIACKVYTEITPHHTIYF